MPPLMLKIILKTLMEMTLNSYLIGEVLRINLDPSVGDEQSKSRPCVVINSHPKLSLITVLPVTDAAGKKGDAFIKIKDNMRAGQDKDSVIDVNQIRTLSVRRVLKKLGVISENELFECRKQLAILLEIDEDHLM